MPIYVIDIVSHFLIDADSPQEAVDAAKSNITDSIASEVVSIDEAK